jgi:hypothetical protein
MKTHQNPLWLPAVLVFDLMLTALPHAHADPSGQSGIGGRVGGAMGGAAPAPTANPVSAMPRHSDAGPVIAGPADPAPQKLLYPPSVEPGSDSATFRFVTALPTVPIIQVSAAPPDERSEFAEGAVVSSVFPALAGMQTRHELTVGNLEPRTRYFYSITLGNDAGESVTETGEFTTAVRID